MSAALVDDKSKHSHALCGPLPPHRVHARISRRNEFERNGTPRAVNQAHGGAGQRQRAGMAPMTGGDEEKCATEVAGGGVGWPLDGDLGWANEHWSRLRVNTWRQ